MTAKKQHVQGLAVKYIPVPSFLREVDDIVIEAKLELRYWNDEKGKILREVDVPAKDEVTNRELYFVESDGDEGEYDGDSSASYDDDLEGCDEGGRQADGRKTFTRLDQRGGMQ
ncbi:Hypothetical protein D9617_2g058310 [Elsinoe fawcettii]|nr:Hypothetical protein D9617_2g058310 [Elsinoe fawcettii]